MLNYILYRYKLAEDERFKLFLSKTLEPDIPLQTELLIPHDISEECALENKVKHQDPIWQRLSLLHQALIKR